MNLAVATDNEEHHPAATWQVGLIMRLNPTKPPRPSSIRHASNTRDCHVHPRGSSLYAIGCKKEGPLTIVNGLSCQQPRHDSVSHRLTIILRECRPFTRFSFRCLNNQVDANRDRHRLNNGSSQTTS